MYSSSNESYEEQMNLVRARRERLENRAISSGHSSLSTRNTSTDDSICMIKKRRDSTCNCRRCRKKFYTKRKCRVCTCRSTSASTSCYENIQRPRRKISETSNYHNKMVNMHDRYNRNAILGSSRYSSRNKSSVSTRNETLTTDTSISSIFQPEFNIEDSSRASPLRCNSSESTPSQKPSNAENIVHSLESRLNTFVTQTYNNTVIYPINLGVALNADEESDKRKQLECVTIDTAPLIYFSSSLEDLRNDQFMVESFSHKKTKNSDNVIDNTTESRTPLSAIAELDIDQPTCIKNTHSMLTIPELEENLSNIEEINDDIIIKNATESITSFSEIANLGVDQHIYINSTHSMLTIPELEESLSNIEDITDDVIFKNATESITSLSEIANLDVDQPIYINSTHSMLTIPELEESIPKIEDISDDLLINNTTELILSTYTSEAISSCTEIDVKNDQFMIIDNNNSTLPIAEIAENESQLESKIIDTTESIRLTSASEVIPPSTETNLKKNQLMIKESTSSISLNSESRSKSENHPNNNTLSVVPLVINTSGEEATVSSSMNTEQQKTPPKGTPSKRKNYQKRITPDPNEIPTFGIKSSNIPKPPGKYEKKISSNPIVKPKVPRVRNNPMPSTSRARPQANPSTLPVKAPRKRKAATPRVLRPRRQVDPPAQPTRTRGQRRQNTDDNTDESPVQPTRTRGRRRQNTDDNTDEPPVKPRKRQRKD